MEAQAIEKAKAHVLEAVLAALGTALPAWLLLAESELAPYVASLQPTILIRIVAVSLVIALWAAALVLYFRPGLKFDPALGIFRDRKTSIYYCPSCHSRKLRSPMKHEEIGWRCVVKDCSMFYPNPNFKEPPKPKRSTTCRI